MSRGLGGMQARFIHALRSLEADYGAADYYIWAVAERMYEQSPDLQQRDAAINADIANRRLQLECEAAAGDEVAARMIAIRSFLTSRRKQHGRPVHRDKIGYMDSAVNLSRTARTLASRGLITRIAKPGYGVVTLTETGRRVDISV